MEALLVQLDESPKPRAVSNNRYNEALKRLVQALEEAVFEDEESAVSVEWLLQLVRPSEYMDAQAMVRAIYQASQLESPAQQQQALVDTLGLDDEAMQVLMEVTPHLQAIAQLDLSELNGTQSASATTIEVNIEEERREFLRLQAFETAERVAILKAQLGEDEPSNTTATHTMERKSTKKLRQQLIKLERKADQARERAIEAGAILDEGALLNIQEMRLGQGGLMQSTADDLQNLQMSLLPEGSRQYFDPQGFPVGTIRESDEGLETVIIPPADLDKANLHPRLNVQNIMEPPMSRIFAGTESLNPLQSAVFQAAYHSRDNLLVCAPTGAGKTNVALLTVAAHLRDVGLLVQSSNSIDTGHKIIYIAPMKALAQEVVEKFSQKLNPLRLNVKELTGDMQLTRAQAAAAHVIVTTPEKWDVVTRKSGTDETALGNQCGLLILDEVHLLADERGAVLESIIARHHRVVEASQRLRRVVGLSATLPNYADVADFLQVSSRGLFYFGPEHRPVPLVQQFMGVGTPGSRDRWAREAKMNQVCFDVVRDSLQRGYQVMVFVHSRKGTGDTATALAKLAAEAEVLDRLFVNSEDSARYNDKIRKSRNRQVAIHFANGIGIHHAGMLRGDRKLTENMFHDGAIKVLVCTATLAWGVNLPAHTVVIKGTDVYNAEKGGITDLSILDVQQIFGRAGRPQFDTSGEATMITSIDAFPRYMDKLVRAVPIESTFIKQLADHLNAEIVGGTVTNVREAIAWLTYTYLYTRMRKNPIAYGIKETERESDPLLQGRCEELIRHAARVLSLNQMVNYHVDTGNFSVADRGRVAAHFYIQAETIETFNDMLRGSASTDDDLCRVVCNANEFRNLKVRQEELEELEDIMNKSDICPLQIKGAGMDDNGRGLITDASDKAFVLLQAYISRANIKSFTLITDTNYISSNASRVARAVFEICLKQKSAVRALKLLRIAKSADVRFWWFQTPLRYFDSELGSNIYTAIEQKSKRGYDSLQSVLSLLEMQPKEVEIYCKWNRNSNKGVRGGEKIQRLIRTIPNLEIECHVKPITSNILRFHVTIYPTFEWNPRWHGGTQSFWLWVEGDDRILDVESILLSRRTFPEPISVDITVPIFDDEAKQYFIRAVSDTWVGVEILLPVSVDDIDPVRDISHVTPLMDLAPLPITALANPQYEAMFSKFNCFNAIQTQLFHELYHTNDPILLGAPTGSGKTIIAELAILQMKKRDSKAICVYIAPLKSLARERLSEWKRKFKSNGLNWKVIELSGDTHHDGFTMDTADILVCTPEKWDLISRGWSKSGTGRSFIKRVKLLVLDEVHLLGEERGAVLEAIVSRTRFISRLVESKPDNHVDEKDSFQTRIVGLSTALANALDLADWIGIDVKSQGPTRFRGLYNFEPSVRPVPLKVHVQGYSGRHYCPRMATMNKPCFAAIKQYSPDNPVLIFVASRRQTRLTAFDIISYAAAEESPKRFLRLGEEYVVSFLLRVKDEALRHTLSFGIGLHHAGLSTGDRQIVEDLYLSGHIQVLVATSTLAWGVNTPARLAIVKGTEYFDGKSSRYVDYPLTDVLQMIGRAGRPGFDDVGYAVVMSTDDKKTYYKKFLYTTFPVESCLDQKICENLNAEIATGTICSVVDAVGYLTWTFYARRVRANPSFYGAQSNKEEEVEKFLLTVAQDTISKLRDSNCVQVDGEDSAAKVTPLLLGKTSCTYYLTYRTPKQMKIGVDNALLVVLDLLKDAKSQLTITPKELRLVEFSPTENVDEVLVALLLYCLASTHEFDELPVRHNEEDINEALSKKLCWGPDAEEVMGSVNMYRDPEVYGDPHTKCFLLIQAHLERAQLPISDYVNDTKQVVENIPRLLAAMRSIAIHSPPGPGSFDLVCQFSRTKQIWETRTLAADNPVSTLVGLSSEDFSKSIKRSKFNLSFMDLRQLPKEEAVSKLLTFIGNRRGSKSSLMRRIEALYNTPLLTTVEKEVSQEVNKASGECRGKLKLNIHFERNQSSLRPQSFTLNIVLGSARESILLAESTIHISRGGTGVVSKTLEFDWRLANEYGGDSGGSMIIRFLWEEFRGLDMTSSLSLTS